MLRRFYPFRMEIEKAVQSIQEEDIETEVISSDIHTTSLGLIEESSQIDVNETVTYQTLTNAETIEPRQIEESVDHLPNRNNYNYENKEVLVQHAKELIAQHQIPTPDGKYMYVSIKVLI